MAVALGRIVYTHLKHKDDSEPLPIAANALPLPSDTHQSSDGGHALAEKSDLTNLTKTFSNDLQESDGNNRPFASEQSLVDQIREDQDFKATNLDHPVAVFPQYLAANETVLTIREDSIPNFSQSFTVTQGSDNERLFNVRRVRPSLSHRHEFVDAQTAQGIMTLRRDVGTLPASFSFEDPAGNKIIDVQGEFSAPTRGSKASVHFTNAAAGNGKDQTELFMRGSWRNRYAVIENKATGEILATVGCNIWQTRNVVGRRRTYVACVHPGVDLALVAGMIIALDARARDGGLA